MIDLNVTSEIGKLNAVITHTPGDELENMTPQNAEKALYSDILNLAVASKEYNLFKGALEKHTKTFEIKELLEDILKKDCIKKELIDRVCKNENIEHLKHILLSLSYTELAETLIRGLKSPKYTLTEYISNERFAIRPLHNFFFTRDASISIGNNVLISKMASKVREREALIMEMIFNHSTIINVNKTYNANLLDNLTIEGGDLLIISENVLCIGMGERTTSQGIDFLIEHFKKENREMHIIVQELPKEPESFIHLDMIFTILDTHDCMVYEPVIMDHKYRTIELSIKESGEVIISEADNIVDALNNLGFSFKPILCGGTQDSWFQEREQWHSGANFFALAPGKILGYARNSHTIDELEKNGYKVIKAIDLIENDMDLTEIKKYVITIPGSELARGGGGCRCMTMPINRDSVKFK